MAGKHRAYVFTVNNYKLADVKRIFSLSYKYVILGYETAPETGLFYYILQVRNIYKAMSHSRTPSPSRVSRRALFQEPISSPRRVTPTPIKNTVVRGAISSRTEFSPNKENEMISTTLLRSSIRRTLLRGQHLHALRLGSSTTGGSNLINNMCLLLSPAQLKQLYTCLLGLLGPENPDGHPISRQDTIKCLARQMIARIPPHQRIPLERRMTMNSPTTSPAGTGGMVTPTTK